MKCSNKANWILLVKHLVGFFIYAVPLLAIGLYFQYVSTAPTAGEGPVAMGLFLLIFAVLHAGVLLLHAIGGLLRCSWGFSLDYFIPAVLIVPFAILLVHFGLVFIW